MRNASKAPEVFPSAEYKEPYLNPNAIPAAVSSGEVTPMNVSQRIMASV